ncbi:hypothetical protein ACHAWF_012134 [Thalassiosira exigua]
MARNAQPAYAKPTYAENLLYQAGFRFQDRNAGERLDFGAVSGIDIERIIEEVDTETLSSLLENITFCDMTEEDLRLYSDEFLVKLFKAAQLIIEYLVDAQDTLSANLNGLAKKYAAKKREMESLSRNLSRQDAEVASLRDELYYHRSFVKTSLSANGDESKKDVEVGAVSRVDPSLYPSQERRQTTSDVKGEDASSSDSSAMSGGLEGTLRLHIAASSHACMFTLNVEDSLSVQNLKNKVVSRLLAKSNFCGGVDYALFHKDNELKDPSQTLKECQVVSNAALVLMPRPIEQVPRKSSTVEAVDKSVDEAINASIESKLAGLTSLAIKSQEELVEASRTLQFHVSAGSLAGSSKDEFSEEVEKRLVSFGDTLRNDLRHIMDDAVAELGRQRQHVPAKGGVQYEKTDGDDLQKVDVKPETLGSSLLSAALLRRAKDAQKKSNAISEMEGLVGTAGACNGEIKEGSQTNKSSSNDNSFNTNTALSPVKLLNMASLVDSDKEYDAENEEESKNKSLEADQLQANAPLSLKVDTNADLISDGEVSPFPPSEIDVASSCEDRRSDLEDSTSSARVNNNIMPGDGDEGAPDTSSSLHYSASSTRLNNVLPYETEERTPTPLKGYLDRQVPHEAGTRVASPSHVAVTSSETKNVRNPEPEEFRFSDYESGSDASSANRIADVIGYVSDEYNTEYNPTLKIEPANPKSMNSDDLQSIEVSHTEYVANLESKAENGSSDKPAGKKKRCFGFKKVKQWMSRKKTSKRNRLKGDVNEPSVAEI